ncbi:TIGR03619 family F420-dependent LLM class oxidoreductase [Phenylobacterium sp. LjRoot219]|uniref:TIGR03619 family F420-dependent LLM class oxidoreductase n=1 Tax=Phenylobacterium sp. LjRoot219 TaxID=3342283 RepID=UPI003ECD34EB
MAPPLKVGLNIVWMKPELQVEVGQLAEQLGFYSVWSGEHIGLPKYEGWWKNFPSVIAKGPAGGPDDVAFGPDSEFMDPLITLSAVAAVTKKVRLGVGIYMLPLREALLAAKMVATLDVISGGRLDLAVGLGWSEGEYAATNNEWKTRGKKLDESIRALRVLFEEETPEFHGDFFNFGPLGFWPKPIQKPLPILIGGGAGPAERRAGHLGNGWQGTSGSSKAENIAAIKQHLADANRAGEPFQFNCTVLGPLYSEGLEAMAAEGVEHVVVTPWPNKKVGEVGREGFAALETYAKEIGLV